MATELAVPPTRLSSAILCASDCAKVTVASDIRITDNTKRWDFIRCVSTYAKRRQLTRPLQLKAVGGTAVSYTGHAADSPQFIGVNVKIVDDLFGEVESQDFSEN